MNANNPQFVNELVTLNVVPTQYGFLKKIKLKNSMNDIITNDMKCNPIFKTNY